MCLFSRRQEKTLFQTYVFHLCRHLLKDVIPFADVNAIINGFPAGSAMLCFFNSSFEQLRKENILKTSL
jgi:hypothetical protein